MTTKNKKTFDAVAYMREQRDTISNDIANMSYEQLKQYFTKSKEEERVFPGCK